MTAVGVWGVNPHLRIEMWAPADSPADWRGLVFLGLSATELVEDGDQALDVVLAEGCELIAGAKLLALEAELGPDAPARTDEDGGPATEGEVVSTLAGARADAFEGCDGLLVGTAEADECIRNDAGRVGEREARDAAVSLEMLAGAHAADGLGAERCVAVFEAGGDDLIEVVEAGAAEGEVVVAGDAVDMGVTEGAGGFDRAGGNALREGGRGYGEEKYYGSAEALI